MLFAPLQSRAVGVGHICEADEEDPRSPVPSSDSRSLKIKHDDVIASTLQILDHLPGGNLDDSRYVLTDNAMRAQLSDNSEHLRPEVTIVPFSFLLSNHGEGLAGKSPRENINCPQSCPLIKTLLCQRPDVAPARHVRPVLFQHLRRVVCKFALPNGRKTRPLGSQIQPADPGKQAQMRQHFVSFPVGVSFANMICPRSAT